MSTFKALLAKVDNRSKGLLFGYNRQHPSSIPSPITYLCLLYYFEYDKWRESLMGAPIKLKDDNVTIEHIGDKRISCNACLTNKWSSGKCQWKFKVMNLNKKESMSNSRISIGIFEVTNDQQPPLHGRLPVLGNYDITLNFKNQANGHVLEIDDIIEMFVDFDELNIKWKINGIDYSNNSVRGTIAIRPGKYIVAVNLFAPGDSIKLL